jgi:hypothetical protein
VVVISSLLLLEVRGGVSGGGTGVGMSGLVEHKLSCVPIIGEVERTERDVIATNVAGRY